MSVFGTTQRCTDAEIGFQNRPGNRLVTALLRVNSVA